MRSYISCFPSPLNPPILNSSSSSLHFVALEELDRPLDCVSRTIQGGLGSFFRRWFRGLGLLCEGWFRRNMFWAATLRVVQGNKPWVAGRTILQLLPITPFIRV